MGGVVSKPTIHFPPNMRHSNSPSQFLVPRHSPCMKLQFSSLVETEEEDPRQTTSTPLWELLDDTRVKSIQRIGDRQFQQRYGNGESISRVAYVPVMAIGKMAYSGDILPMCHLSPVKY